MSEHELPADLSSWPTDPYRLLGVERGIESRDLRRAYLRLIRRYKPEHAPEEFRRIREAYDQLNGKGGPAAPAEPEDWSLPPQATPPGPPRPPVAWGGAVVDPWEQAIQGSVEWAYRDLALSAEARVAPEDVYLQLYWLLLTNPRIEPGREPVDWLVRGLIARGEPAGRLFKLFGRETSFDPASAVDDRLRKLFEAGAASRLLVEVAACRWQAVRGLGRWDVLLGDVETLRAWAPAADEDLWARLLVKALTHLVWVPEELRGMFAMLRAEADRFACEDFDPGGDLTRADYADEAASGLLQLARHEVFAREIHDLLRFIWERPSRESRRRLVVHLTDVATATSAWLERYDRLKDQASVALLMIVKLPDQLGVEPAPRPRSQDVPDLSEAVVEFLGARRLGDYPSIRPQLLEFCRTERVSPGAFAAVARDLPKLKRFDGRHLSDHVEADLPLAAVYRACAVSKG